MSEPKKISFGFSKLAKKTQIVGKPKVEENERDKVELIECLEGQSIKVKDEVKVEYKPLVLHIPESDDNLLVRIQKVKELKERSRQKQAAAAIDERPDSELTLDELAARQLLLEARKLDTKKTNVKIFKLPVGEDNLILEGSEQATLNDYEDVPIGDFGWAMMRGMGVTDEKVEEKNVKVPELRPKGMGLGAHKVVNQGKSSKPLVDKDGKELKLEKGACAKIIAGRDKGNYCKVHDWDSNNDGIIIVKMALKGAFLSVNEFLLTPVSAEEYALGSKVINNAKYEQFKEKENKEEVKVEVKKEYDIEEEYKSSKRRNRRDEDSAASHKNYRKDRSRSRSRNRKSKKKKHRKQRSSSSSSGNSSSDGRSKSRRRSSSREEGRRHRHRR